MIRAKHYCMHSETQIYEVGGNEHEDEEAVGLAAGRVMLVGMLSAAALVDGNGTEEPSPIPA